jgi:hypothetical protein
MFFWRKPPGSDYSDSVAGMVNCALRPGVSRIETAGAGSYQGVRRAEWRFDRGGSEWLYR